MNKGKINIIVTTGLILSIGLVSGYSIGFFQAKSVSFPFIEKTGEQNPGVCTIKLLEVRNGQIRGRVDGTSSRLAYSTENIYDLEKGESFSVPIYGITLGSYYDANNLPEGMAYIASSKGKYFYHVLDPRAFRITPKNRRYFANDEAAVNAGFLPSK